MLRSSVQLRAAPVSAGAYVRSTLGLAAYRGLTTVLQPALWLILLWRAARGREERRRLAERRGVTRTARPQGRLLWVHAASVGEAISALPLIEHLRARHDLHLLLTTTTTEAARVVGQYLPRDAIHQYLPVDHWTWARRFLDHWRPDHVLWVESDFWPAMLAQVHGRGIPAALVNARMSERSARRWRHFPALIRPALDGFRPCLTADKTQTGRLLSLGVPRPQHVGNLKAVPSPMLNRSDGLEALRRALGTRPRWMAASTHAGEEHAVIGAHLRLRRRFPELLTIIAPRHVSRAGRIVAAVERAGLRAVRRSTGALPGPEHGIYLVDTMGELGLFYRASPAAFLGGSLVPLGGHNPCEPVHLDCVVVHGSRVDNFRELYAELHRCEAACAVDDAENLAAAVRLLLLAPEDARAMATRARAALDGHADVVEAVYQRIQPVLHQRR